MSEQSYTGGCHCGAVRYKVVADISRVITCNCSICHKKGTALAFAPAAQFTLTQGEESLTEYRFNTGKIAHLFCKTCGVQSFSRGVSPDGAEMAAINVRCLDGVDLGTLDTREFDGKSL